MKQFWYAVSLLTGSLLYATTASAQKADPVQLLGQMTQASRVLNYEFAYINVSRMGIESLRYRHALIDDKVYAQLLPMDGPKREVFQRGDDISYFEPGVEPFTLSGNHIVDALPSIVYADINHIRQYYDILAVGRTRVADQLCDVIRIVAKDGTRFSYIVWQDTETKLPLRIDLLDRDGETLEQYRVVSFAVDEGVRNLMKGLQQAKFPPSLSVPEGESKTLNWQVSWIPAGMKEVSRTRRNIPSLNKPVESRLYSDGLFSFSVNVSPIDKNSREQLLRTGRRTVQVKARNNVEITVVGELPATTARRVAEGVEAGNLR